MDVIDKNNQKICEKLWHEYEKDIRRLCEFKLRSCHNEIEDVVSETFLFLVKAYEKGNPPNNPKGWLYAVANNLIKKKYTEVNLAKARTVSLYDKSVKIHELPTNYEIDNHLIADDTIEMIRDDIESMLDENERRLFDYIYNDKLKMKEIGKILNITEDAVKQRHYRLCRKIKRVAKEKIENFI